MNRSFGGVAAESVLIEVATRLRRVVRAADSVAQLRDDEFAVLLEEGHRAPDAVAERIVEGLRTTVDVGGQPVPITASVGLALGGTRRMNAAPAELITSAQHALLQAKEAGKDRYPRCPRCPRCPTRPDDGHTTALGHLPVDGRLRAPASAGTWG